MKILVIGSGGREHAICKKLLESKKTTKIYNFSENAGICDIAETILINPSDHNLVVDFCKKNEIDFVFVGPEKQLVEGLVDVLQKNNIKVFGPTKYCANLEGSKDFMKNIASLNNIPTAKYKTFVEEKSAIDFGISLGFPCVVKADGLASGKGVVIVNNIEELSSCVKEFLEGKFSEASKKIIIEEFLIGTEVSHFAICDGEDFISLGLACDHKKVGENETGLNTGGMGTYSPVDFVNKNTESQIVNEIVVPTLKYLKDSGNPFTGILFSGIILTKTGPKLLEFNVRFGDPETQVILPRIKSDFVDLMDAVFSKKLSQFKLEMDNVNKHVCVVVAAKGYPNEYIRESHIENIDKIQQENLSIIHAGTIRKDKKILSSSGRVLNFVASAKSFKEARAVAYNAIHKLDWKDGFVRNDIAKRAEMFEEKNSKI